MSVLITNFLKMNKSIFVDLNIVFCSILSTDFLDTTLINVLASTVRYSFCTLCLLWSVYDSGWKWLATKII